MTQFRVITSEDIKTTRQALKEAKIKASVRKGKGSCRCQITISTIEKMQESNIDKIMEAAGFTRYYPSVNNPVDRFHYGVS